MEFAVGPVAAPGDSPPTGGKGVPNASARKASQLDVSIEMNDGWKSTVAQRQGRASPAAAAADAAAAPGAGSAADMLDGDVPFFIYVTPGTLSNNIARM